MINVVFIQLALVILLGVSFMLYQFGFYNIVMKVIMKNSDLTFKPSLRSIDLFNLRPTFFQPQLGDVIGNATLKVINGGYADTGTDSIAKIFAKLGYLPSLHYHNQYIAKNLDKVPNLRPSQINSVLKFCVDVKINDHTNKHCQADALLEKINEFIQIISTTFFSVSGTPLYWFLPEITARIPGLIMVLTTKDVVQIVDTRLKNRNKDIICKYELWNHPKVLHPFDIINCLLLAENKGFASDVLTDISSITADVGKERVVEALNKFNQVSFSLLPKEKTIEVSFFETENLEENYNRVTEQIKRFVGKLLKNRDIE